MDMTNLVVLVKQTRDAQKAYFKTRDKSALAESKRLEKELDRAVDGILGPGWNAGVLDFGD